ncbi:MAG TPA: hypothetical protein VL859_11855, partial [Flavobacterium sp.]|nr:hypothetical protein [Flavobacterium sp.]
MISRIFSLLFILFIGSNSIAQSVSETDCAIELLPINNINSKLNILEIMMLIYNEVKILFYNEYYAS